MNRVWRWLGVGMLVAAVAQELRKPASEREWHGQLFDFVPYDFRPPTLERVKSSYWNPDTDRLFTSQVFGVGWAVNLYRVREMLRGSGPGAAS